jgi:5-methylcytosine-specific restriction endonuclease McrA
MSEPEMRRKRPSPKKRKIILKEQGYRCLYCGQLFGSVIVISNKMHTLWIRWDHMTPYCHSFNNHDANFTAACQFCNGWKSDQVFNSLEEIKVYVGNRWQAAMRLPGVRCRVRPKEELAEVLQSDMSGSGLESAQSESESVSARCKTRGHPDRLNVSPDPPKQYPVLLCDYRLCRNPFPQTRKAKHFCSDLCRIRDWMEKHPRLNPSAEVRIAGRLFVPAQDPIREEGA